MPKKKSEVSVKDWPASRHELWPLSRIKPYAKNPRRHPPEQIEMLARDMKEDGVTMPILVDERGIIIAGHGRLLAAQRNEFGKYPVVIARGWSETQKKAVRLKDNQLSLLSSWDSELVRSNLSELKLAGYDMPLLGFSNLQLMQFMASPTDQTPIEPEIPPLPKVPVTKRGDVWDLDGHRIACGDCRVAVDVGKLLDGAEINVAFTSPPYAEQRDYDEASGFKPVAPDNYVEWFKAVADNVCQHLSEDGSWFVNIKPSADGLDTYLYVMDLVIAHVRQWGWHFATEFCWERSGVPKSVTRRFKNQFEPVYQFSRGEWKMRPSSVMHPSADVPLPFGPGAGQTSRKSAQGGNGAMFGRGRFNARPPGRSGGQTNDQKLQGQTKWENINKPSRGRPLGVGPTTASKLQGIPGAYGRDTKRRKGYPTGEANQGTSWQANGMPLGIPLEEIGEGMAYPGNRLPTFAGSHEATGHAAAFPVGLPAFFVRAYSDEGDAIYDPFLGSGSTLLAAAQHDRIGYGMEISPAYVDVAVERWQRLTGGKAKRISGRRQKQTKIKPNYASLQS